MRRTAAHAPWPPPRAQIWARAANFHFGIDEPDLGLRYSARALQLAPAFDAVVFTTLDRLVRDPHAVLAQIGGDGRACRAYAGHLMEIDNVDSAETAWTWCFRHGFNDRTLTVSYINALLRNHRYGEAQQSWSAYLGTDRGDYPSPNLISNGGFESEPSDCPLDWRITPSGQFETARDFTVVHGGKASLRIGFQGSANVYYTNTVQLTPATPGKYHFRAWIKTEGITTNQGPEFQIYDSENPSRLDVRAGPFLETTPWTRVDRSFTVPDNSVT